MYNYKYDCSIDKCSSNNDCSFIAALYKGIMSLTTMAGLNRKTTNTLGIAEKAKVHVC